MDSRMLQNVLYLWNCSGAEFDAVRNTRSSGGGGRCGGFAKAKGLAIGITAAVYERGCPRVTSGDSQWMKHL